ncbi:ABC transporter ATP-binding protein [Kineosporia sp. J2-2]|uniref:ABC transporter ATP-binding protein n=1 Tax=Kineosporia corallincola TaxID=2835133 RepID=A0ABS5TDI8_9ACTN|nr:ABC transporter ATP-binding protein [Kineosporia corallincola]MBT0769144.1 ABC transporter ATP-binding protein [Kineosporia corallincola]
MTTTGRGLQVRGLTVRYGRGADAVTPLRDLDLDVPAGQFLCVLGPSGQGKSTLLRCLAGLLRPAAGSVLAHGVPVTGPGADRGMVFQQDAIPGWLRVADNIALGPRGRGLPESEWRERVSYFTRAVGLDGRERAWPRELSGGMRRRVAIAAVFANDPEFLLMDEPFGSLDHLTRAGLHETVLRLWRETEKTVVFVTHDVDEAIALGDRIVVVAGGGVRADVEVPFHRPRGDELRMDGEANALRSALLDALAPGTPQRPGTPQESSTSQRPASGASA